MKDKYNLELEKQVKKNSETIMQLMRERIKEGKSAVSFETKEFSNPLNELNHE